MTPLAVEMLIWFCCRGAVEGNSFPNVNLGPQSEILAWFLDEGIVDYATRDDGIGMMQDVYRATEKGQAWLAMMRATPMPVQQWVDPREIGARRGGGQS